MDSHSSGSGHSPIVDADTHINEVPAIWADRLPAQYREKMPRIVDRQQGGKSWRFESGEVSITRLINVAGSSPASWTMFGYSDDLHEFRAGAWDPKARLEDMDVDMVDVHVMYPTFLLGGASVLSPHDRDLQLALVRAYNDWISDFAAYDLARLGGVALIPTTGVDDAVAEMERVRARPGIRAALLSRWPNGGDEPDYAADDRFWAAAADLDLAVSIHVGFGEEGEVAAVDKSEAAIASKVDQLGTVTLPILNQERQGISMIPIMSHLILSGTFERHRALRVGAIEVGAGWVPFFLEQTDDNYLRHRFWTNTHLPVLPSAYWERNCFTTFQIDEFAVRHRDEVGIGTIMWSSDYPHSGADWPNSQVTIGRHMHGVPPEDRRMILGENALRFYGMATDDVRASAARRSGLATVAGS
jgi:predicted TIM-barrel fold metal-dependent hydrolase